MTSFQNGSQFTIEDNVLKGKVVSDHYDRINLGEFTLRRLEDNPDFVGQIDVVTGEESTYGKMRERSVRCALWMRSQGLRPRDVVALCFENHNDFAMPCFAALYLGAAFVSWDVTSKADDFRHRMIITKPKMAFVSESLAGAVAEAAKTAKLDTNIIVFGSVPGFLEFDSIIAEPGIDEMNEFVCTPVESSDEIAMIIFTSGTTGLPKGVALSHRAFTMLMHQARAICMTGKSYEARLAWALIEKYRPSWVNFAPEMIHQLIRFHDVGRYDLSSLTTALYSGAQISMASYRAFKELVPNIQIYSAYGMTECCGYISIQSTKSRPGSCGEIMENAQLKVIDLDTGRTLGANRKGEILLKFARMMSCYYNDPQATARLIDEEGWIHSGDLGYYDERGEIFVIDRLQDVIRSVEYDVSPFEIESVILSHPGVKEVAVVGQPQPEDYDWLIAFVVRAEDFPDTSKRVTETDIINLVAAELPDSRRLRAGVKFIDRLPRTPTNKIRRTALRDLAKSMVTEIDMINLAAAESPDTRHVRAGVRFIDDLPKTPSNKIQRKVLRDLAQSTITI